MSNTVDPQLRPRFFDADPNSADAAKRWNHWFRTFETYLKTVQSSKPDNLETLIHFVDPLVYDHIADHTEYESAIDTLRKLYVRPKNVIYARYLLQTYKQENGQDIDQFVRKLKSLAKDCEFKSVSATEYQDECVRDAIINGLASTSIREKLLAQSELTLDQAYQLARSLELAHKQSQSYLQRFRIQLTMFSIFLNLMGIPNTQIRLKRPDVSLIALKHLNLLRYRPPNTNRVILKF
ncbi:hypothetical protein CLF_112634 [Clonorchis sinensis]|uniref:Uncharacterized protein n=1 Tax=Clonorchis sinensis TaxID=79923 RepID=G7YWP8_CLOSI|nr:hypothetical protein CLF_112634 [Clonorchis sinensis]